MALGAGRDTLGPVRGRPRLVIYLDGIYAAFPTSATSGSFPGDRHVDYRARRDSSDLVGDIVSATDLLCLARCAVSYEESVRLPASSDGGRDWVDCPWTRTSHEQPGELGVAAGLGNPLTAALRTRGVGIEDAFARCSGLF